MKITTLAPDASGLVEWPTLSANRKSVVTVGVFDGMHRGHQAVIRRAVELAKADKAFSVVVMFDPRPGVVHAYAAAHDGQEPGDGFRDSMALTSVDQRLRTLENLGVDHVLIDRRRPLQLWPVVVRQAHIERLAAGDGLGERAHRFLQRSLGVRTVMVEDVDVVESQAFQALVE